MTPVLTQLDSEATWDTVLRRLPRLGGNAEQDQPGSNTTVKEEPSYGRHPA